MLGIDPGPFTLRELVWMLEGRREDDWFKFSILLCKLHNVFAGKRSQIRQPRHFNPFYRPDDDFTPLPASKVKDVVKFLES